MHRWENPEDRVSILQMNSELQHAQLELLSAHCATHQLRLRFSMDDLVRFGRRDVLRKSIKAASALNEYYASIEQRIPDEERAPASTPVPEMSENQIREAVARVSAYLQEQHDHYLPSAKPLSDRHKTILAPYFSAALLEQVRIVQLKGTRVPTPPFFAEAKALGFVNLPDFPHMASLTFLDVIVFNEAITERPLFHALVHSVQFRVLGLERYTELFVRSFVNTKFHFTVPIEAHAFSLEARFAPPAAERFSVEDQVRLWVQQNRY
jgi:hypothetical protein